MGVVVSSHRAATAIGISILEDGGNAVDAAVATGLAVGVADPFNSGIGGGGFILVRLSDGSVFTVDGRETAPAAAYRDMFLRNGKAAPERSRQGPLAVGVPGLLAGYALALERAGSIPLGRLIEPSIRLAEEGFVLEALHEERIRRAAEALKNDPASKDIFLLPDGKPRRAGALLQQPDLAETYRQIAEGGTEAFYRGVFARKLAAYMAANGGVISLRDLEEYRAVVRPPVVGRYNGTTVYGMPPPSSGGILLVEVLNMLEASGVLRGKTSWDRPAVFWTARFLARAFQDRATLLGDDAFTPVPTDRLIGRPYAQRCVLEIMGAGGGKPRAPVTGGPIPDGHTTNIVAVDRWGNAVCINQTINLNFGAKITLPGTGVLLNNEMDDFSAQPGVPNAFGLVGSEANAVEPGKRPLSSMCPAIIVRDNRPVLVLGGAGGPMIITAVLQTVVDVIDFGMPLPRALLLPRFHHQYLPDVLVMENGTPFLNRFMQRLSGNRISIRDQIGVVNAVAWEPSQRRYLGAADPRAGGTALGY